MKFFNLFMSQFYFVIETVRKLPKLQSSRALKSAPKKTVTLLYFKSQNKNRLNKLSALQHGKKTLEFHAKLTSFNGDSKTSTEAMQVCTDVSKYIAFANCRKFSWDSLL